MLYNNVIRQAATKEAGIVATITKEDYERISEARSVLCSYCDCAGEDCEWCKVTALVESAEIECGLYDADTD